MKQPLGILGRRTMLALWIVTLPVTAAEIKPAIFYGGTDLSSRQDGASTQVESRGSISSGLMVGFPVADSLLLETGIVAPVYRYKSVDVVRGTSIEPRWMMIEIPFGVQWDVFEFFNIKSGTYFSFAPSSGAKATYTYNGNTEETEMVLGRLSMDFGIYTGVGVRVPVSKEAGFFADFRYLIGLRNFAYTSARSEKMNQTRLMLGAYFSI